jgi:glycosyltransferase involved in cell wall biosynthesis
MADSSPLVVLAPYALRDWSGRPRRFLDPAPLPLQGRAIVGDMFENDEQLERDYHRRQRGVVRRMIAASCLIARNYTALHHARMIYCLDGMHYAILLLLSQCGLFRTHGKIIRRLAFHDSAWQRLSPRLRNATPSFQIECITREQFVSASQKLGENRVIWRPWKIDTGWFQPAFDVPKTRALLPGNISRDESIVPALLHQGISITRVARLAHLQKHYAVEIADPRFELVTNASHHEYRELLLAAPAVLLPIVPCDGSAGLTAAMEAIASGVPVLANRSMGLTELFAECEYPIPMLSNLDPEEWAQAYRQIEAEHDSPDFLAALDNSRRLLLKHHRILPMGDDWAQIFAEACAEESSTCEDGFGAASPAT